MSIIQQIQDKYGKFMAVIIGLSLVVFVVMLAFENGGGLFRGDVSSVGKINGERVDIQQFQQMVEQQTNMMQQRGMGGGEALSFQANEAAWNAEIARVLLNQQTEKLGISIGKKELNDLLFGTNPPQDLRQAFSDPQTGQYNPQLAHQQITQIRTQGTADQKAQLNAFLDQMAFQRLAEKYDALLTSSINFPKWMIEKENAQSSLISKISYVRTPYASIADSAVKVTLADVEKYVSAHKNEFKQEASRSISYVAFNAQPSATDSAKVREQMLELKAAFDSTDDVKQFLVSQGVNNYYEGYIGGDRIQVPEKDAILAAGPGQVYGPYLDGTSYSLSRIVAQKAIPDTVSIRHILIGLSQQDPQTGAQIPIRDTTTAKHLADSIALAIRNGANFDSLALQFSTDMGSAQNGGRYEDVPSGQMVPEFNDFIFGNPTGTKGVVKTDFGYHYIEILSQKGSGMGYKIAYISKPIEASKETDDAAYAQATKFAAQATDGKAFTAASDKLKQDAGVYKSVAQDIPESGYMIQGLGTSRSFVKSIYKAEQGDVLAPERVGDFYVVGLLTEVNKKGTMTAAKARTMVEPVLINEKKAALIAQQLGKITSLEAAASTLKQPVETADSLRFSSQASQALGFEPKVLGAAFNKENVSKVIPQPIAGSQGVYILRVDQLSNTPVEAANVEQLRNMRYMQTRQQSQFRSLQALQEAAEIEDNRSTFY
ncbi:SurA N-terminal domain-containing protein [Niabella terrae]